MGFFHSISDDEFERVCRAGATWADIMHAFDQPAWCVYPDALDGIAGCWSLILRHIKGNAPDLSRESCCGCPENATVYLTGLLEDDRGGYDVDDY